MRSLYINSVIFFGLLSICLMPYFSRFGFGIGDIS